MKHVRNFLFFAGLICLGATHAFAVQSADEVRAINRSLVKKVLDNIRMQKSDPVELGIARAQIDPLLDWSDLNLSEHLLGLVETTENANVRFLILGSSGSIGGLENPSAFNRLMNFFENSTTSSSDRTSASNSWREAAFQSGNPTLIPNLGKRVQSQTDQEVMKEYLFFLILESRNLKDTDWYFRFLTKSLEEPGNAPQVRLNAASGIAQALFYGHVEDSSQQSFLIEVLINAAKFDPDLEVRSRIIREMGTYPDSIYKSALLEIERAGGETGAAAKIALSNLNGGTPSSIIWMNRRLKKSRWRASEVWSRIKSYCSLLGD